MERTGGCELLLAWPPAASWSCGRGRSLVEPSHGRGWLQESGCLGDALGRATEDSLEGASRQEEVVEEAELQEARRASQRSTRCCRAL